MDDPKAQLLPGTLYLLILRTLESRSLHGYAIAGRIREASSGYIDVEEGSLYPALQRMLTKSWLSAEWGMSASGRKARFYALTEDGRRRLDRDRAEFERMTAAIAEVLRTA
jgi:PadR family transcriptional regulator